MFTKENAAFFGKRGAEALWRNPKPKPSTANSPLIPEDGYVKRRQGRVRAQIENVSDMLDKERDPQRLDRLAAALERLVDMERVLDGRPLPGNMKPQDRPREQSGVLGWIGQQSARQRQDEQPKPAAPAPQAVVVPESDPGPQAATPETPPDTKTAA
jgi:hypothetical protein